MRVRRILCPVDFGATTEAGLAPATSIATEYGGELILLHVLNFPFAQIEALPPGFDVESYYQAMADEAGVHLADLIDVDAADFMQVTTQVERGVPYQEIARVCAEEAIDLVVIPTHGRHGLGRLIMGSTAEKVVRMVDCPVLTVHAGDAPAFKPKTVLCATDFSDTADDSLRAALDMAERYEANLILLHVVTLWEYDPGNPSWRFPALPEEYEGSILAGPAQQLQTRAERATEGTVNVETMLLRGHDPAEEIVRVASDVGADLVVMGTHGHTGIAHALLGSVAGKVIRSFTGPVLTVRQKRSDDTD
jgi:nucleotide-binding universal stress UspA family protein